MSIIPRLLESSWITTLNPTSKKVLGFLLRSALPKSIKNIDAIDSFTNELVEKKTLRWGAIKASIKSNKLTNLSSVEALNSDSAIYKNSFTGIFRELQLLRSPNLTLNIKELNKQQIDNFLIAICEEKHEVDFLHIIRQCIISSSLPSLGPLRQCFDYLSEIPRVDVIMELADLCKKQEPLYYKNYAELKPFLALAFWRCGKPDKALETLIEGFDCSVHFDGRKQLQNTFRIISFETVGNKSPAILVALNKTANYVYAEYNDIFVIACFWRSTFTSEWLCDQKLSEEIFAKFKNLRRLVFKRASHFCYASLLAHDIDAVHRMIQLFLKYDGKKACRAPLKMLFGYHYRRKDLRACSEIMRFSLEVDLPLSDVQNYRLLNLLLNRPPPQDLFSREEKLDIQKFVYKF